MRSLIRFLAAVAAVAAFLAAQINTGRVSGFVNDTSGAAVPAAQVRATNDATGTVVNATTKESGEYLLNFLLPGTYRVEVTKEGFQKYARSAVTVNAGGIARIDFELRVGELRQVLDVQAAPIAVSTDTSELSQTFSHTDLDRLPNLDRNPLYQVNLMPGANNDVGSGNYGTNGGENGSAVGLTRPQLASVGGVDANANSVYIEGIPNREPQNAYVGVSPPIEGIQEVQVYTGKYNAEFGFSGSAVINVVTKSGTNEYHGVGFEFVRNNASDARNFFATTDTPFRRNQFGGALGGPVMKNKLFFFADYQRTLFSTSSPGRTTAPTSKMYNGDFSELYDSTQPKDNAGNMYGQIYDPFTRQFDANGNVTAATPFTGNIIPASRWDAASAKIDAAHIFGSANLPGVNNNLYYLNRNAQTAHQGDGRLDYIRSDRDRMFVRYSILSSVNDNSTDINQFFQNGNADSVSLNQNMQISDLFTISANKMNEFRLGYNRTNVHTSNKSMDKNWNNSFGIPNGNLGDIATQGIFEFGNIPPLHNIGQPDWVAFIISNTISMTENFTWVKGSHNIKVGTNLNHVHDTSADTIGGDDPRGAISFDPAMTSYDGAGAPFAYPSFLLGTMTSSARARFVAGVPYQTYWQNAWYAQDDYKVLPSLTLNLGLRYELVSRPIERFNRQSNWDARTNQLLVAGSGNRAPALNLDKNDWGPRLGFAWSPDHGKTSVRAGYGISYWMAYWAGPLTIEGLTYPFYAKQAFNSANNLTPNLLLSRDGIPVANAVYDSSGKLVIPSNAVIRGVTANWKSQRVDQRSFNIEREIRPGIVLDIGYLGVTGSNNLHGRNINQAPPGSANVDYQTRRPLYSQYPNLGDIPVSFSEAGSWYDAITARLAANVTRYIFINASYAHGRNFSNGNDIDQTNVNQYYGPTQQDIAHIFNAQFTLDIPVGRGKPVGGNMNRALDLVVGGWQYSSLVHIRSGTRFDVYSSVSLLNNGQGNRPNRIGNGEISNPTPNMWFDTSAFVDQTQEQTYGTAGINPLHADGQQQLDSSLFKSFHLTERIQLQFRADVFNSFNHANFSAPDSGVGSTTEGQVSSTSVDPRRFQFGLRLFF